jgi:DNA-binding MarR family transcriptional regulator
MTEEIKQDVPLSQQGVRHLGQFRHGVTYREATLDGMVLRRLYRRGKTGEGLLANISGHLKIDEQRWTAAMDRLERWGMIEFEPVYRGEARKVTLTSVGQYWAEELICQPGQAE